MTPTHILPALCACAAPICDPFSLASCYPWVGKSNAFRGMVRYRIRNTSARPYPYRARVSIMEWIKSHFSLVFPPVKEVPSGCFLLLRGSRLAFFNLPPDQLKYLIRLVSSFTSSRARTARLRTRRTRTSSRKQLSSTSEHWMAQGLLL